jgi:hypothetical protein
MVPDATFVILIVLITVGGSLAVILAIALSGLRNKRMRMQMLHQQRMAAIEKGLPVPLDLVEPPKKTRPYVRGFVFTGIGLGVIIMGALDYESGQSAPDTGLIGIGTIFLLVGLALILGDWLTQRREALHKDEPTLFAESISEFRNPPNP